MTSKNWSRRFAPGCVTISLTGLLAWSSLLAQEPATLPVPAAVPSKPPAIALIDGADTQQWETWMKTSGWRVIAAPAPPNAAIDQRVQGLTAAVQAAIKNGEVDPGRVYLAGRAEAAAAVVYTVSRVPDLWAAAIALGGSLQPAVDTDRIFAVNFTLTPLLWVSSGPEDQALAARLTAEGLNLEWRSADGFTEGALLEWLGKHKRDEFPASIDCETNSPTFASCYWIQMTKFDVGERNDVLPSTKLKPGSGAALDFGAFGYKPDDPGPGILVSHLPDKYSGPLKMGDRIISIDGRPIENAKQYADLMAKTDRQRPTAVMIERGNNRIRLETLIVMPHREPVVTARVQAQYNAEDKDIQIISRTIKEMRVTIPPHWAADTRLYWNGLSLEKIEGPGCVLLTIDKELLHAAKCP